MLARIYVRCIMSGHAENGKESVRVFLSALETRATVERREETSLGNSYFAS